jgi:prepilin-type N-terminal cleavage/methylation domain-containing protein
VAIRPPKYNSQGFTLIEMVATLALAGIIMAFAFPSLMTLDKPLKSGTLQFKNQLSLIRSKAISGSRAYRIRPRYPTFAEYKGEHYQETAHNFIVEYATNCQVTTYGSGLTGAPDGWQAASQLDLDLPDSIGVASTPLPTVAINGTPTTTAAGSITFTHADGSASPGSVTVQAPLNWSICYDNRGIAYQAVTLTLQDSRADNRSRSALISVGAIGSLDITTKDSSGASTNDSNGEPVF